MHGELALAQRALVAPVYPGLNALGVVVVPYVAGQLYDTIFVGLERVEANGALRVLLVDAWIELCSYVLELVDLLLACEVGHTAVF